MSEEEANKILEELNKVRPEKLNKEAKRLFEAIMKITDERDKAKLDLTTVYMSGYYDGEKKWEDKIKAKIEFIKSLKEKKYYEENVINVLQSLLEKE